MQHHVEVILVLTSPDLKSPALSKFLVLGGREKVCFPYESLGEQEGTLGVAARMLESLTGLKTRIFGVGWVDLWQAPIADNADRVRPVNDDPGVLAGTARWIGVPYAGMIPGDLVPIRDPNARWVTVTELMDGGMFADHLEILRSTCNRI